MASQIIIWLSLGFAFSREANNCDRLLTNIIDCARKKAAKMSHSKSLSQLLVVARVLKPYKKFLTESILTGLLLSLLAIPGPWLTKILIDSVCTTGQKSLLYFVVITMLCFAIFQAIMRFLRDFFIANVSMRMTGDIQMLFLNHLQKMSFKFYESSETGEVLSRFSDISSSLNNAMGIINVLAFNLVQIIIFPIVLLYVSWKLTLFALIVVPFEVLVYIIFNKYVRKYTRLVTETNADLNARVVESLEGIKTIQSLQLEKTIENTIRERIFHVLNLHMKLTGYFQGSIFLQDLLNALGTFLFTFFGWKYILNGEITLGSFIAFTNYVGYFYGPFLDLLRMNRQIEAAFTHTNRFLEIYDTRPQLINKTTGIKPNMIEGYIRFRNVCFSYDGRELVLNNIDLDVPPKTVVALVGRSGVGKTTMANLIARFYEPSSGVITIDGYATGDLELAYLRSKIGYVMQEPFLFNGTIKDNILLGLNPSEEDFDKIIAAANVDEFISKLPDGHNTIVGQRGLKLSQGQKQRIALARVLLRETPILIFDEPTSSLDIESEESIQEAMKNVFKNRTTIIIAHRLTTIRNADVIVVLEDKKILEKGNHKQLIDAGNYYYQMHKKMAKI